MSNNLRAPGSQCSSCSHPIPPDDPPDVKFCSECGARLDSMSPKGVLPEARFQEEEKTNVHAEVSTPQTRAPAPSTSGGQVYENQSDRGGMSKVGGIIGKVGGIIGMIAGVLAMLADILAFKHHMIAIGLYGIGFSFLVIVFGVVALYKPTVASFGLIACSIGGMVFGSVPVAVTMVLSLIGGLVCLIGGLIVSKPMSVLSETKFQEVSTWAGKWALIGVAGLIGLGLVLALISAIKSVINDKQPVASQAPPVATPPQVPQVQNAPPASAPPDSVEPAPDQAPVQPVPDRAPAQPVPQPVPVPVSVPVPTASQPEKAASPTSGVLRATVALEHGQAVFENLPGGRLKFTFDHDAWQATIRRKPNGTQTLVMRSLRPGIQTNCDVLWEIVQ